jgi:DNA-binding NarL/FixJ family response regulator
MGPITNRPIGILIADDHPVFRFGMRTLLTALADFTVLGEATTGEEAVQLAATLRPDLVLMDINLPGISGIEATSLIHREHPQIAILIVTMLDDTSVFSAMRAGARGYLLKGAEPKETVRAIQAVASGEAIFSPGVAERIIDYFAAPPASPESSSVLANLSEREQALLTLIAQGYTNSAIAERLVLSPKTVRNYISEIYSKLQVADRVQAVLRARESGLG